ncbi:hypothetical protein GCM10010317_094890 [Streptomyces mirabilis]|nr:hypothetical protein GCM10010317_094890 [Streptomyces mirabilis]
MGEIRRIEWRAGPAPRKDSSRGSDGSDAHRYALRPVGHLEQHPFHWENGERLIGFIKDVRDCHTTEDFVTFQRELLHATLAANVARAECSRVIKRLRTGQSPPAGAPCLVVGDPHDLGDLRMESEVLERVARWPRYTSRPVCPTPQTRRCSKPTCAYGVWSAFSQSWADSASGSSIPPVAAGIRKPPP